MRSVSASRHDRLWHPGLGDTSAIIDAFSGPSVYWQRQRSGVSRNDRTWSPGLGELSTAEIVARKLGIPGPYINPRFRGTVLSGLGQTTQQISAIASTGASATVGILVALGTVPGPVGAAIGGIIAVANALVGVFKGCGQTCTEATSIANQVSTVLTNNVQAYVNSPVRTVSMQQAAINNYNTAWAALVANCNNPSLGTAGQNCISQRQAGACAYKTSPGGWTQNSDGTCTYTWAGANGSGTTCWNWPVGFLDPIQNDPCVQPDSAATSGTSATGASASTSSTTSTDFAPLLLIAGGIALAMLVL